MNLTDKIYRLTQQSRKRIIETMRERNIAKLNLVMTPEEFCKENGFDFDNEEQWSSDYDSYVGQEAPTVVLLFDDRLQDYVTKSVELQDGEHPRFKLDCYHYEDGNDTFNESEVFSMSQVYATMEEILGIDEEPDCVWVFTANQASDDETFDTITKLFFTKEEARKYLYDFVHGEDGEAHFAEKRGWTIDWDNPDWFQAYDKGYYSGNHTECTIDKFEIG